MQLSRTIGITRAAEQQLALAFTLLARRHQRDADIRDDSSIFAQWCERHVTALDPIAERYGE